MVVGPARGAERGEGMSAPAPRLTDATATLAPFVDAGVLDAAAVHVAAAIDRAAGGVDPDVLLGAALAARGPVIGHVCVVPTEVAASIVVEDGAGAVDGLEALPWPDPDAWARALAASPAVRDAGVPPTGPVLPLVWDGTRLYLERYHGFEQAVADDLRARAGAAGGLAPPGRALDAVLDRWFGPEDPAAPDRQRAAAEVALTRRLAVVAGGPGTGKTRTIARLLAAARELALADGRPLEVVLAAPTGKAAARMTEAVHRELATAGPGRAGVVQQQLTLGEPDDPVPVEVMTLHRLLGWLGGVEYRRDARSPLPHDLVVVDETSMVSLPLMARLLAAVRRDATVVLVGDPDQLASVEAGAVLGEVVGPAGEPRPAGPVADRVVVLDRVHRFRADSAIAALGDAVRTGDAERALALLRDGTGGELQWIAADDTAAVAALVDEVAAHASAVVADARAGRVEEGLARAVERKVLSATRRGPLGSFWWNDRIEAQVARSRPGGGFGRRWYVGRPVIVTRNDYQHRLVNGDVGLVVARDGRPVVAFPAGDGIRELGPAQLEEVETWWAMTIHKSQGSEFDRVVITLPPAPSPVLTRELVYTAVTRARRQVTVVASEESLRGALARPVARASGLAPRLHA